MKPALSFVILFIATGLLAAAEPTPKEAITAAAKQLAEKQNYSWHSETVVPEDARFRPGPIDGKTEKGGFALMTWRVFDNDVRIVQKGDGAAYTDQDGVWQRADAAAQDGPGRWMSLFALNMALPAKQAEEIVNGTRQLSPQDGAYSGELTEAGAKALMTFRRGGDGPSISDAQGTATFWLTDGLLTKYQYKVRGRMSWNGNEVDIDRETTVKITDVDTTTVDVPEQAKAALSADR